MSPAGKWGRLQSYNYSLPEELIAQHPLARREQARLMAVDRRMKKIYHERFADIGRFLPVRSHLVINDSKVIPARLIGRKASTGAGVEVFVLKRLESGLHEVLMRPMKRLKNGDKILFPGARVYAQVVDKDRRLVSFSTKNVMPFLLRRGKMPLPPYIKREDNRKDRADYHTVYAKNPGSVAAPTAGLHFTRPLMERLRAQGHTFSRVTLHINYGTFKPVEAPDIRRHPMHREYYRVSSAASRQIERARSSGRSIVAVGTTSCRVLESWAAADRLEGETDLFIYPGYEFKRVDGLITNFHLPFSTLLMLVYAFGGPALMQKAYNEAVANKYRFYSYGDGMIII